MSVKKLYTGIQDVLRATPREEWPTSNAVSRQVLGCPRVHGFVRELMMRRGVSLSNFDDVLSDTAVVMQMKMMKELDGPDGAYSLMFRIAQLVVSNYGKKSINTFYSKEISLSSLLNSDDDESGALERLSSEDAADQQNEENERRIDVENARRRFAQKLNSVGWPSDIKRERTRMGRPPKQNPIIAVKA